MFSPTFIGAALADQFDRPLYPLCRCRAANSYSTGLAFVVLTDIRAARR